MKKKTEKPAKGSKTKSGEIVLEEKPQNITILKTVDVAGKVEWLEKSNSAPFNTIGTVFRHLFTKVFWHIFYPL